MEGQQKKDKSDSIIEHVRTKLNNNEAQLRQFREVTRQMGKGEVPIAEFYTAQKEMLSDDFTVKLTRELAKVLPDEPKRLELLYLRKAKALLRQQQAART